ncbi:MAG: hypothetical protein JRI22_17205 [Deltaproteobacteria bacterium]|nr:hypothetical protein [Deltaproteobacteria bacterium]
MLLLPPDMNEWPAEGDPVYFIMDVVSRLDLSPIYRDYDGDKEGRPPYDPSMMVSLLICALLRGYCRFAQNRASHVPFGVLPGFMR